MAEHRINESEAGQVDFNTHARDYARVMKLLKWGTLTAIAATFFILRIIAN